MQGMSQEAGVTQKILINGRVVTVPLITVSISTVGPLG